MKSIIASGMKARLLIVATAAILVFLGVSQLRDAPIGIYPEFSPVYVEVQTEALGLSADEVEQLITVPIESDLLNGVAWLKEIRSESIQGLSSITLIFEDGTDPMKARQVVAERLTQAHALPNVSKHPIMLEPKSSTSRVMMIGVSPSSEDLSLVDVSVLARWTIQPYLMGVKGVANVSIWGNRNRQLQVQVDPNQLRDKGVALLDIVKTAGEAMVVSPLTFLNSSTPGTGGFFDTPNQRLGIRHLSPITSAKELAQVAVYGHDMVLSDVADVVEDHQPLIGDAIVNGSPSLLLVVEKYPWATTSEVTERVEDALEVLKPGLTGITFDTQIYQPASFVDASFGNTGMAAGLGIGLMVLLLFFLMYEWRAATVSIVSILSALFAGMYVLYLRGVIFNMVIIAGMVLALGVIIDEVLASVENVRRRLAQSREGGTGQTTANIILDALSEMRGPLLFASLIMLLSVTPLFFLRGISGAFLQPFASSYALALLVSLVITLTVTPALSAIIFTNATYAYRESPLISVLRRSLDPSMALLIRRPGTVYLTFALFVIAGLGALPFLRQESPLPIPQERDLVIKWDGVNGTSYPEMSRITNDAVAELRTIPGVTNVAAHIGRAVTSDKVTSVNSGEIWVSMDDDVDYKGTVSAIRAVVEGYPGLSQDVQTYPEQQLQEAQRSSTPGYAVRLYGEKQDLLNSKAEEVMQAISGVVGVSDARVELPAMEPTFEIEVNLDAAKKFGIKPGDVRRSAATLLSGIEVGSLFEGQKIFEVVVWGKPATRSSMTSIRDLLIDTPGGGHVRLGDVADVRVKPTLTTIRREGVSRYMDVSFKFSGAAKSLEADIFRSLQQVKFPMEFHADLVGGDLEIQDTKNHVMGIVIAALIGIFLLLQAAFWTWRLALVVFVSLSMALAGGMLAVLVSGGDLSLGSKLGLLLVLGIAARHSIGLISHFKHLELFEGESFGYDLVLRGVRERFAPIMMTTITTGLVYLVFAIFGNAPGLELTHPMSLAVLGGLITSAILNLLVLPVLYLRFGKVPEKVMAEQKAMLDLDIAPSL